jgi:hypothetical protein
MLICVDGTGPTDDDEYAAAMNRSFVMQIAQRSTVPKPTTKYFRGPEDAGITKLVHPATIVMQFIKRYWESGDQQIFMTGYSRGGAIVIEVARILYQLNPEMEVEALFLFDPVQRDLILNAQVIPPNVKHCYVARRDRRTESRLSFGNCGLFLERGGIPLIRDFFTTHGGMGGVPWGESGIQGLSQIRNNPKLTPATKLLLELQIQKMQIIESFPDNLNNHSTKVTMSQETKGMEEVKDWMWEFLRKRLVVV